MKTVEYAKLTPPMVLNAKTAADLMTPNPISIGDRATVAETMDFLARHEISGAPVIDEAGRPVGVVSRADLLRHKADCPVNLVGSTEYFERLERPVFAADREPGGLSDWFTVRAVMTPVVFYVAPNTPADKVVEKMVALGVRRLFVVDADGVLTGVISGVDVLRKLRRWGSTSNNTGCS